MAQAHKQAQLTPNRERVLREAVLKGWSQTPGGYKLAFRDARHWWSAVEWLTAAGFVVRPTGTHGCRPTEQGRALVASLDKCVEAATKS
jgi:hypothetical protein